MNPDNRNERQRTLALLTVMLAFVLDVADSTIVNTALPAIRADLAAGPAAAQWMVAGYFLSFSILLVAGGRLGDMLGHRRLFLLGVGLFTGTSLGCGLAQSAEQLVGWRLAQGASAAMMGPQVMAIVQILFTPVERIAKLSWFGTLGGLAAILGPILGGLLITANVGGMGWRSVFLINLPVGLVALVAGWRFLPHEAGKRGGGLDVTGTVLLGLAFTALLVPLVEGPGKGWPVWTLVALGGAVVLAGLNVGHARRLAARGGAPLIQPVLFGERTFSAGLVAATCFSAGVSGFVLVFAVMMQSSVGRSALETALLLVPFGLGVSLGIAVIGRKLLPKLGKWVPVSGATGMGLACASVLALGAGLPLGMLLVLLALGGLSMGLAAGPLTPIALARVERHLAGTASGMLKAAQQIGGALGAALVGGAWFTAGAHGAALVLATVLAGAAIAGITLPRAIFADR